MKARLARYEGDLLAEHHVLGDKKTTIGRELGNQIQMTHPEISKQHCEIYSKWGKLVIEDLGSANGVTVNGQRIKKVTKIKVGDKIGIGPIVFVLEVSTGEAWSSAFEIDASENAYMQTMVGGRRPPQ